MQLLMSISYVGYLTRRSKRIRKAASVKRRQVEAELKLLLGPRFKRSQKLLPARACRRGSISESESWEDLF